MKSRTNYFILTALALLFILSSCQTDKPEVINKTINQQEATTQVETVLAEQAECWSAGDLDCYMQGYWKSDSLLFVGKSGLTYGWQQTLDNYKRNYPDASAMGKLTFDLKETRALSPETILVVGKWHLQREATKGNLEGHFSVIFKQFPEGWKIVADHSS